jgi:fructuronate reductase
MALRLTAKELGRVADWTAAGVKLPAFDIGKMSRATEERPAWVHFGAGNIFRGFIAHLQQRLLNAGLAESGIVAVEAFDFDIIDEIYAKCDNLILKVSLKPDGGIDEEIIAGVAEALRTDRAEQYRRLKEVFANPSLQMASLTLTEKGYALSNMHGDRLSAVEADIEAGPEGARHAMGILAALMLHRYRSGAAPIALVSMDNFSHNGDKLRSSVLAMAGEWAARGFADSGFMAYLVDESRVSFPWTMIDKITPRPSALVQRRLADAGIEGMEPIITGRQTHIAPFVNCEAPEYLVIEDEFPNGRPPLEKAGVYFADRETVDKTERMKVTTCLNPLHSALAIFGCLLGYESIADEMADPGLRELVRRIGYDEGLPVAADPGIISPRAFLDEVIERRLPNPFIPDAPQRIATDTSQKMAIRFGETIKSYQASPSLGTARLTFIPLTIAGWCRYLLGRDDELKPMTLSGDPMLPSLRAALGGVEAGEPESYTGQLRPILSNPLLFSIDLYGAGLGERIEEMFGEMLQGAGAVRRALSKRLGE